MAFKEKGEELCNVCRRRCPVEEKDCVTIQDGLCPETVPAPFEECEESGKTCLYEPYCGTIFIGSSREKCTFLTSAECDREKGWEVMSLSFPERRNPTCEEVKSSWKEQGCCGGGGGEKEFEIERLEAFSRTVLD